MANARVSVVIPCYNTGHYLREAIDSARAQSPAPHELLVVDDGSTDDSARAASGIPGVRLVSQANQGVSEARNRGMLETSGEFVVFHDADDRLLPGALEIGVRELAAHPECAFVYGFSRYIRSDGTPIETETPERVKDASYARMLGGSALVPPSCAMFRRSAIEAIGGFTRGQALAEDYDFYLRMTQRFPVYCHNQEVVEYRRHPENASGQSASRTLRAVFRTLDKQRPAVRGRPELERALLDGKRHWGQVFGEPLAFEVFEHLRRGALVRAAEAFSLVVRYQPRALLGAAGHYRTKLTSRALRG
ncbi:MAG: glycosyltransferase family 2 protein [Solirubrobacteraceae bacterium]